MVPQDILEYVNAAIAEASSYSEGYEESDVFQRIIDLLEPVADELEAL